MNKLTTFVAGMMLVVSPALADTANINGAEIYYEVVGEGLPIMLMHGGLGLDHTYFRPYFDQLESRAQVIYYDHLGNGRSERPADFADMTFARMVADADALREHLGIDKMVLIGHSYGGFIAQEYAAVHGDHLSGLVLANTVPKFDYAPSLSGTDEQMAALGALFSKPSADDAELQALWVLASQMYYKNYDAEVGARIDAATHYSAAANNAGGPLLGAFDTLEKLPTIDVPTLSVGSDFDGITPYEHGAARIAGLMPNAILVKLEDSGHFPFIEEEAHFFEVLNAWLDGLE